MRIVITLALGLISAGLFSQSASLRGQLQDADGQPVIFANVVLYQAADSSIYKVETSDEAGLFQMKALDAGDYFLVATFVGSADLRKPDIRLTAGQQLDLGVLRFSPATIDLEEATVTASRVMVEVKPDRTVFNVDGTINSVGDDALNLLRKAPAVTVDNNDNISVLGRSGVLIYVDGKRLPLSGQDLSNYLQNLPAEQIDRIDIITNPGAKYEAEGNAGIIDIRLKKDKNLGSNGSVGGNYSQGRYGRYNLNGSGNYRNKTLNAFGSVGFGDGASFNEMNFLNYQNGIILDEAITMRHDWKYLNLRLGTDFFLGKHHTLGFLVSGNRNEGENNSYDRATIAAMDTPGQIDSVLIANNLATNNRNSETYNINYRFDNGKGRTLNIDADYGRYDSDSDRSQPNRYYDATEETLLTEVINSFETPTTIDISTLKVDFEDKLWDGQLGLGAKVSRVVSDNTFLFYDVINGLPVQNNESSNLFDYEENVFAGYFNYARKITDKWSFSAGLRAEQTDAIGMLEAFLPELQEPPVEQNYLSWFPNAGLTWQAAPKHTFNLNYGRRINRPDYNVLNPFNNRLSELSYEKGNPFLRPEIVNNLELGYTLAYRYNFKLAYSRTTDQITRLIAPDENDPRAGFITWENLAEQTVMSFNVSAPVQIMKKWNAYFNVSASYLDNQADYGDGAIVDVQAATYSIFQQHTFDLPGGFKGEISGYFSGPGVWGGVFKYDETWSLNLGLQRKFLQDALNVRLSFNDIFYQTGWNGTSSFNGLESKGNGNWDSRRGTLSISYNFGNQNVKSRRRNTGLEEEAGRVGGEQ